MGYSSWPNYGYIGYLYAHIFRWYMYMYIHMYMYMYMYMDMDMYMYSCRRPDVILSYTY